MATQTAITPIQAYEVPHETAASAAFTKLLESVRQFIAAERDLADVNYSMDPAYNQWMRDAELAHECLTDALRAFHGIRIEAPSDRPLKLVAKILDAMLGHEEPGGAKRLLRLSQVVLPVKFQLDVSDVAPATNNAQLLQVFSLLVELVALPLFDGSPDDAVNPDAASLTDGLPCDMVSAL